MGDKCDSLCGYAFDGKDIVEQGTYLLMRGINITEGIIRHSAELDRYYTGSVNNLTKYKLTTGDLIIGMDGSKVGRNSAIVSPKENGSYLVQRVCRIKSCIGNDLILQLVNNHKFHKYVDMVKTSSAIPHISLKDIQNFPIAVPLIQKEADKISRLFHLIDERIATQNKIIEDLKKLKSAISHILFSSKCAIHLSDIANVVMGQSPSSNAYNDQGIGMPLVQGNLDISNGKTIPRLYTAEFNKTAEEGNIILTVRAPVGEVAKATKKVCLGRGVCAIIPHEENMSDFIYQYLTFYKFMWRRYEQGSTFTSINGSDVRNIPCPKVRNVSILTLLDRKTNIEERVIKLYQSQKQYMLCQMFI